MHAQSTDAAGVAQLDLFGPREIVIRGMQGQIRGVVLVDAQDYERISRYKWHIVASRTNIYGRRWMRCPDGTENYIWMHRELVDAGDWDGTVEIDHKDGNGLNNQRSNLIVSDRKRNGQTRRKLASASSAYRGVSWAKDTGKWQAQLKTGGRNIYLGQFPTELAAAEAARAGRAKYLPHSRN